MFSGQQVLSLLGMTYRQLDYWATKLLNRQTGSGKQRSFDMDEVMKLAWIRILSDLGMKPGNALEHLGASEIHGGGGYCTILVDLDTLKQDVSDGLDGKCSLVEAAALRTQEANNGGET